MIGGAVTYAMRTGHHANDRAAIGLAMAEFTLRDLEQRIDMRAKASAEASYTRTLIDKGVAHCAKKLGEEAVEVAIAAIAEDRGRVIAETADLIYHLLVVLHTREVTLADIEAALEERTRQSGIDEKAARKGG
jgi:phosphoribosyl-ATP pyrophosphohydrolase